MTIEELNLVKDWNEHSPNPWIVSNGEVLNSTDHISQTIYKESSMDEEWIYLSQVYGKEQRTEKFPTLLRALVVATYDEGHAEGAFIERFCSEH